MYTLGILHANGLGVEQDGVEAKRLYEHAAAAGSAEAKEAIAKSP